MNKGSICLAVLAVVFSGNVFAAKGAGTPSGSTPSLQQNAEGNATTTATKRAVVDLAQKIGAGLTTLERNSLARSLLADAELKAAAESVLKAGNSSEIEAFAKLAADLPTGKKSTDKAVKAMGLSATTGEKAEDAVRTLCVDVFGSSEFAGWAASEKAAAVEYASALSSAKTPENSFEDAISTVNSKRKSEGKEEITTEKILQMCRKKKV